MQRDGLVALNRYKARDENQPFLGLVASYGAASGFWQPLPDRAARFLQNVWPLCVSVIWKAGPDVPQYLCSRSGEIGLRVPKLPEKSHWLFDVLEALPLPLPTTSVNRSGEDPASTWAEALNRVEPEEVYIPDVEASESKNLASTVIRITDDGLYEVKRSGAVSVEELQSIWEASHV
jgi:tRNA A37 threonylcarbamoyladenosine synthetase subunit TsaC/SUA5/YrdC